MVAPIGANHAPSRENHDHARYRPIDTTERWIGKKLIHSIFLLDSLPGQILNLIR
jgi:hypothetical protein